MLMFIINFNNFKKEMHREYICGCGKSYGSYPAFSTHKKLKHKNQLVEGTVMPPQEKAKRGRPSFDFKKIPKVDSVKKQYYEGLNVIENGLLEMESEYKGQILSDPYNDNSTNTNDLISELSEISSDDELSNQRIEAVMQFTKLITTHTSLSASKIIVNFLQSFIAYGLQAGELLSLNLYNTYFRNNQLLLKQSEMGIQFYFSLCLILSKWLYTLGKTDQTLKVAEKAKNIQTHMNVKRNTIDVDNKINTSA